MPVSNECVPFQHQRGWLAPQFFKASYRKDSARLAQCPAGWMMKPGRCLVKKDLGNILWLLVGTLGFEPTASMVSVALCPISLDIYRSRGMRTTNKSAGDTIPCYLSLDNGKFNCGHNLVTFLGSLKLTFK